MILLTSKILQNSSFLENRSLEIARTRLRMMVLLFMYCTYTDRHYELKPNKASEEGRYSWIVQMYSSILVFFQSSLQLAASIVDVDAEAIDRLLPTRLGMLETKIYKKFDVSADQLCDFIRVTNNKILGNIIIQKCLEKSIPTGVSNLKEEIERFDQTQRSSLARRGDTTPSLLTAVARTVVANFAEDGRRRHTSSEHKHKQNIRN